MKDLDLDQLGLVNSYITSFAVGVAAAVVVVVVVVSVEAAVTAFVADVVWPCFNC